MLSLPAAWLFANCTWFDGVLGHHGRALQDLAAFFQGLQRKGPSPRLVVTGDLTRVGAAGEFDNAAGFLSATLDINPPQSNYVGLNQHDWQDRAIPGNHDHWPGRPVIFGGPDPAYFWYFPQGTLPYVRDIPLRNGRVLQFIGVDTDADVSPRGHQRLRAVGSFQSQLAAAALMLHQPRDEQIRVLLMHHSWHRRGPLLSIDRGTRGALAAFLAAHGVRLVLTGHTHEAYLQPFVPNVRGAQPVLECRSGTTTQVDHVPYSWRNMMGRFPARHWPANTLLVHSLYDQGRLVCWEVQTYTRLNNRGFVSLGPVGWNQMIV